MDSESSPLPNRKHPPHHPTVESRNHPVIVFLTVCTAKRRHILATEPVHHALCSAWNKSTQWVVGRYLIMPDHIHLFCAPAHREAENVAKWTTYWKKQVSTSLPHLQPIWQRHCWDTQLRSNESYDEKWHYIRHNPVRCGWVQNPEEWPFQGVLNGLRW